MKRIIPILRCIGNGTLIHRSPVLSWNRIRIRLINPRIKMIETPPIFILNHPVEVDYFTTILCIIGPLLPWTLQLDSATISVSFVTLILISLLKTAPSGRLSLV
jgi:hypothetical protein